MPCYDGRDHDLAMEETKRRQETDRKLAKVEAMLCAVLTVLDKTANLELHLEKIDEKRAGVTMKEILSWWKKHVEKDKERRKKEIEAKKMEILKNRANVALLEARIEALQREVDHG